MINHRYKVRILMILKYKKYFAASKKISGLIFKVIAILKLS